MNTEMQLFSISRKNKPEYEHGVAHKVYENKLNQDFHADAINQKWCTDFSYLFLTDGSKRYNCTILDLQDRSVIASITDRNITSDLAKRTSEKAKLATTTSSGGLLSALQRAIVTARPKGRYRKHLHWSATKRYFLNLLFLILLPALLYIFELLHQ